jgi:hypothetical protein
VFTIGRYGLTHKELGHKGNKQARQSMWTLI